MSMTARLGELRAELPRPFATTAATLEDRTIISVEGELDRSTVAIVRRAAEGRATSTGLLVLDLSATTFVDSSGLHLIEELAADQAAVGGRDLVVIGVTRTVRRALALAARQSERPLA